MASSLPPSESSADRIAAQVLRERVEWGARIRQAVLAAKQLVGVASDDDQYMSIRSRHLKALIEVAKEAGFDPQLL